MRHLFAAMATRALDTAKAAEPPPPRARKRPEPKPPRRARAHGLQLLRRRFSRSAQTG